MPSIFSQQENQKIHSPERLNTLVEVTRPRGWIALLALCLIVIDALAWAIFGTLPLNIEGEGLLVKNRVVNIDAKATGILAELVVQPGFRVQKGDVVARLRLPDIQSKLDLALRKRDDLLKDKSESREQEEQERLAKLEALRIEERALPGMIETATQVVEARKQELMRADENLRRQLIVQSTRNQALASLAAAEQQLQTYRQRVEGIVAERSQALLSRDEKLRQRNLEIANLESEIAEYKKTLADKSEVKAEEAGIILEHMVASANMVSEGKPIMRLEPDSSEIEAVVYVPAEDAKKIAVDERGRPVGKVIPANISPSTVKPEEFGFIRGTVSTVSAYPVTKDGLMQVLNTDTLVERLTKDGSPIEVRATLIRSNKTVSGYQWSSSSGPSVGIASGTLCKCTFEIERKRPITYIIPAIRKTLGL